MQYLVLLRGAPACVDGDTEFFNGVTWKPIKEYIHGDKVLQYTSSGYAELVEPLKYHKVDSGGFYHIVNNTKTVDQMVSPDHRIIYVTSKGNLNEKLAEDVVAHHNKSHSGFKGKFINHFKYIGNTHINEARLRLLVAISADGYRMKSWWRVRIFKEYKIERLKKLITDAGCQIIERVYKDGSHNFYIPLEYGVKEFPISFYDLDDSTLKVFVDEVVRWDGNRKDTYRTTIKNNADIVQFAFSRLGRRVHIRIDDRVGESYSGKYIRKSVSYEVHLTTQKYTQIQKKYRDNDIVIRKVPSLDGNQYCFTVPSGMLVLRRNNGIFITGNCGKSTFIKEHYLEPYTLCADQIRMQVSSPVLNVKGEFAISQKQDKYVWETLFVMLEKRMQDGCFTVVDATHYKTSLISPYKKLAQKYGYRVYIVDFTDVPYDVLVERNSKRPEHQRVPVEVIKKMTTCFTDDTEVRKWCTVIKPEEFEDTFTLKPLDLTDMYDQIYVFGDIHGCYTAFKNFIDKHPLTDRTCYIFVGDYTDRGLENKEMVQWLLDNYQKKNVVLLKSNHTVHLEKYANEEFDDIRSSEFKNVTAKQLEGFDKKDLRQLCRKFIQMSYFEFDNDVFLVTHGGIPGIDLSRLAYVPTIQFIKGVGDYADCDDVDASWTNKCGSYTKSHFSVHGHRNVKGVNAWNTNNTFNLDSKIEYGEPLRVLDINKSGMSVKEEPNPVHREMKKETVSSRTVAMHTESEIVNELNHNRDIIKKDLGDGYYSFNFSRDVFFKKNWSDLSKMARGLFCHLPDGVVVARSYEKFFNIGERHETELSSILQNAKFPVMAYHKYNGYLGLLSYDFVNDGFFIATKSTNQGDYKDWFKQILTDRGILTDDLKHYLKDNDVTFVFEVIDPFNDPHIIEYDCQDVVLLDIIRNSFEYEKYDYSDVLKIANRFGIGSKYRMAQLNTKEELEEYIKTFDTKYTNTIEGAVFEDANGWMFKYKTKYYKFWKEMRKIKDQLAKGHTVKQSYVNADWISFYKFLKKLTPEQLNRDIITLRNEWNKTK